MSFINELGFMGDLITETKDRVEKQLVITAGSEGLARQKPKQRKLISSKMFYGFLKDHLVLMTFLQELFRRYLVKSRFSLGIWTFLLHISSHCVSASCKVKLSLLF